MATVTGSMAGWELATFAMTTAMVGSHSGGGRQGGIGTVANAASVTAAVGLQSATMFVPMLDVVIEQLRVAEHVLGVLLV